MINHEIYIFNAGWAALADSRCKIRNSKNQTVEKATAAGIGLDRMNSEEGQYFATDAQVQLRVSDIPSRGFAIGSEVEVLQPVDGGAKDWQAFRIGGKKIAGGVVTYTLEKRNYEQS